MCDITKIKQDFDKKVAEIKALMKNPHQDASLLGNSIEFRDKNLIFQILMEFVLAVKTK